MVTHGLPIYHDMATATTTRTVTHTQEPLPKVFSATSKGTVPSKPSPAPQKKVSRQPIFNWFQRKLAGGPKARRASDGSVSPNVLVQKPKNGVGLAPLALRNANRISASPLPPPSTFSGRTQAKLDKAANPRRKTISLNRDGEGEDRPHSEEEDMSTYRSSLARDSMWSPTSAMEADEDASVRPLPPSSPPSPSPSHSSASYLSGPHTFRSMGASTKQTTVLSVDLTPHPMAHIAQAPPTPTHGHGPRFPHIRTHSNGANSLLGGAGGSITFSALPPPSPQSSTGPSSNVGPDGSALQAPLHTSHHPRNNPRPSSPPNDNASVLTLASSAFAVPGSRVNPGIVGGWSSTTASGRGGANDSMSHFGGGSMMTGDPYPDAENTSQYLLGDDDRLDRDVDASVRALRPRSSRRGSWASEASGWSAGAQGLGGSHARERSLWTTNSNRTGGHPSGENEHSGNHSDDEEETSPDMIALPPSTTASVTDLPSQNDSELAQTPPAIVTPPFLPSVYVSRSRSTDTVAQSFAREQTESSASQQLATTSEETKEEIVVHAPASPAPNAATVLAAATIMPSPALPTSTVFHRPEDDGQSVMDTQSLAGTDYWHSAPSTPMAN